MSGGRARRGINLEDKGLVDLDLVEMLAVAAQKGQWCAIGEGQRAVVLVDGPVGLVGRGGIAGEDLDQLRVEYKREADLCSGAVDAVAVYLDTHQEVWISSPVVDGKAVVFRAFRFAGMERGTRSAGGGGLR